MWGPPDVRFVNPLPFVSDIAASRRFYCDVIGLIVSEDHGDCILFDGGFGLHDGPTLERRLGRAGHGPYGRDNLLLYFATTDLDAAFARIAPETEIIHPITLQPWGERVFRVSDPDGHLIEIGDAAASASRNDRGTGWTAV
jgi:catechol 2,3-dioxygenase-like lactoylglutathione lyase family enzyme